MKKLRCGLRTEDIDIYKLLQVMAVQDALKFYIMELPIYSPLKKKAQTLKTKDIHQSKKVLLF